MSFLATASFLVGASVILSTLQPSSLPLSRIHILSIYAVTTITYLLWKTIIATYLSPFCDLPSPNQGPWYTRFLVEPDPGNVEKWINEIPNDGLIRYFGAFNRESLLATRPDVIKEFLQVNGYKFSKLQVQKNIIEQVTGHGLLVVDGEEHKHQRKSLSPAFKFKFIKDSYPKFWAHTIDFVRTIEARIDKFGGSALIDPDEWLQRVTFDIIGDTGFGLHVDAVAKPDNEVVTTLAQANSPSPAAHKHRMLAFLVPRWALWNWPSKRRQELDHMVDILHQVALPLIKARRELYAGKQLTMAEIEDDVSGHQTSTHNDIIATILRSPQADTFTDEFLVAQSATFLLAGQDTTSVATTWALHLLSKHPEVQSRLREEIRAHLPSPDDIYAKTIDANLLESLPLLYAVCNETLRLYAPAPQIRRTCVDPTATIQGRHIPVGMTVNASQWATQRSRHIWGEDVLEFKPERFLKKNEATGETKLDVTGGLKGDAAVYGNIPFGAGFRSCIGERFARAEFAALLAGLVGRLEWLVADETPENVELNWGIVTKPAKSLQFKTRKVEGW